MGRTRISYENKTRPVGTVCARYGNKIKHQKHPLIKNNTHKTSRWDVMSAFRRFFLPIKSPYGRWMINDKRKTSNSENSIASHRDALWVEREFHMKQNPSRRDGLCKNPALAYTQKSHPKMALPFNGTDYFLEKPGYAIITEGVHDLSVDCMNTSFLFGEL